MNKLPNQGQILWYSQQECRGVIITLDGKEKLFYTNDMWFVENEIVYYTDVNKEVKLYKNSEVYKLEFLH